MGFRSITTRLTFSYFFASLLVLVSLSAAVLWAVKHHLYEQDRYNLQQKFNTINELRVRGDFISQYGPFFERGDTKLWLLNGNQVEYQSQSLALPKRFINKASMERIDWQENGHHYRAIRFPLSSSPDWYAVLGLNIDLHITFLSNFKKVLLWITFFASIVSGFLSWFIARKGLKPLAKLEHYVDAISTEELSVRVPQQPFPEELLPLVARFNRMLSRLQGDFERLSEFSSDIAHELRTPIGNMMTQTQVMLAKPRSEQEYRDILESNAEELSRLTKTISDMLYLAKSEHNLLMKNNEPIDLKLLLGDLAEYYELAGDEKSLTITCFGEGQVVGDRNMLKRAFRQFALQRGAPQLPREQYHRRDFPAFDRLPNCRDQSWRDHRIHTNPTLIRAFLPRRQIAHSPTKWWRWLGLAHFSFHRQIAWRRYLRPVQARVNHLYPHLE